MKRFVILAATIALLVATSAMADLTGTVRIQGHNNAYSSTGPIRGDGITSGTYYTGVYSWVLSNQVTYPPTGEGSKVPNWGFCMDLPSDPVVGWYDVRTVEQAPIHSPTYGASPMGTFRADYVRELAGRYWNPDWGKGQDKVNAEAFSYALWEIVYEPYTPISYRTDSDPLTKWYDTATAQNGTAGGAYFSVADASVTTIANNMLNSLTGDSSFFDYDIRAITHADGQDFLVQIPIPGAALLGLLGFSLIGWIKRRFA